MVGAGPSLCIFVFMKPLNLPIVEAELKKRTLYPYNWFRKQNDTWDNHSNFIYETPSWDLLVPKIALLAHTQGLDKHQIFQYAANRWYNFWSAKAVEQIFTQIEGIEPVLDSKDSEKDFYLFGIPFDHKTSVFPKRFNKSFDYAQTHKPELIVWLYKNQSTQKRYHLKNRLFLIVYDSSGAHWKLKAEIALIHQAIHNYIGSFTREQLHSVTFDHLQTSLSDIIWVSK